MPHYRNGNRPLRAGVALILLLVLVAAPGGGLPRPERTAHALGVLPVPPDLKEATDLRSATEAASTVVGEAGEVGADVAGQAEDVLAGVLQEAERLVAPPAHGQGAGREAEATADSTVAEAITDFAAGAAAVSITPTADHLSEGVYLGGYGIYKERGRATGVHDPIYARALAIAVGDARAVLVILDVTGIGNKPLAAIRSRAAALTRIPPQFILVGATHTHAGPDLQGLWGGVPASYREYLVSQTVRAIQAAVSRLEPATLVAGSTAVPQKMAGNRRGWGFTDTTMTVLQFRRKSDGETIATLVNYAVHPTIVGGNEVSTDFVGPLEASVEESHGGVALFFNGAQGDSVPGATGSGDEYARAAQNGCTLADHARVALQSATAVPAGMLLRSGTVRFNIENNLFRLAYHLGWMNPYYHVRVVLTREGLFYYIDSRVVRVRLGDATSSSLKGAAMLCPCWMRWAALRTAFASHGSSRPVNGLVREDWHPVSPLIGKRGCRPRAPPETIRCQHCLRADDPLGG